MREISLSPKLRKKRDSSARGAPRNDNIFRFSASCLIQNFCEANHETPQQARIKAQGIVKAAANPRVATRHPAARRESVRVAVPRA
jgi:hypothetical protein